MCSRISKCYQGKTITIFGKKFPTKDGTCLRDYIHIRDICNAIDKSILLVVLANKNVLRAVNIA